MRRDCPAASTSAATLPGLAGRSPRAAAAGRDLRQQAADAHAHDVLRGVTGMPAAIRCSTQSKPFSLGERQQPGRPSTGALAELGEQQQVAGIDRHAEMLDLAARRLDRRRQRRLAVGDRRGAGDQQQIAAARPDPLGERRDLVGAARFADQAPADRGDPLGGDRDGLVEHRFLERPAAGSGSAPRRAAGRARPDQRRRLGARSARQRSSDRARRRERDDLDGRDHLPRPHRLERRQASPTVTASSTRLRRSMRARSTTTSPACSACRLTRPVNGLSTRRFGPGDRLGDQARGLVLVRRRPARAGRRSRARRRPRAAPRGPRPTSRRPFFRARPVELDRVREDRALGLVESYRAELHGSGTRRLCAGYR